MSNILYVVYELLSSKFQKDIMYTFLENERIKQGKCYCLPPSEASPHLADLGFSGGKQEGEGCTKAPLVALPVGEDAPTLP